MTVQKISFGGVKPKMTPAAKKRFNETIASLIGQCDKDLVMIKNMKKTEKPATPGNDFIKQAEKFFSASLEFFQK